MFKAVIVFACTALLAAAAIVTVTRLQQDATDRRDAELALSTLRLDLAHVQDIPWGASPEEGNVEDARGELEAAERDIRSGLDRLAAGGGLPERKAILTPLDKSLAALWDIFDAMAAGDPDAAGAPSETAAVQMYEADEQLSRAARRFRSESIDVLTQARNGSALAIVLLFAAFGWFYRRSARARRAAERLTAEKRRLLAASRQEALTDSLTGLRNRRALMLDLEGAAADAAGENLVLALFDLDGFKVYNDSFGHPAGDALLTRLGARLAQTMEGIGTAYRMGGDEFCIVSSVADGGEHAIAGLAAAALSEEGVGFSIGCSYGIALLPMDTRRPDEALRLADLRMYEQKASGRISPSRQSADVLLRLLAECSSDLERHTSDVAELAVTTAQRLGLRDEETERIRLAAELHDVGKAAIPDAILNKPGKLEPEEWEFIRRHTVIGERIIRAAPSLAHTADLVRASHERMDGTGYPDRLAGDAIPIGARIIAVCDAFDAMVSDRPYRAGMPVAEALAELQRCAGTQFDAAVVRAFEASVAGRVAA